METTYLIALDEICAGHNIEPSFIDSLQQFGLLEITTVEQSGFVTSDQLQQIEKFIHFHYDLDINIEGIESIHHLLQRINSLQDEISTLRNKLRLYEGE